MIDEYTISIMPASRDHKTQLRRWTATQHKGSVHKHRNLEG